MPARQSTSTQRSGRRHLTFREWCALKGISERTGRRVSRAVTAPRSRSSPNTGSQSAKIMTRSGKRAGFGDARCHPQKRRPPPRVRANEGPGIDLLGGTIRSSATLDTAKNQRPPTPAHFEQAKKPTTERSQFLQIVAKPKRGSQAKAEPKLTRVAFKVSRLMEFCSERELQNQTGHSFYDWPLVVGKETVDNALDACEEARSRPTSRSSSIPERSSSRTTPAASIPRPLNRSSIIRSGSPAARRTSPRPAARRAMR